MDTLKAENGIDNPARLRVGTRLTIPVAVESKDAPASEPGSRSSLVPPPNGKLGTAVEATPPPAPSDPSAPPPNRKYAFLWPTTGQVTSRFGKRWGRSHDGIDIGAPAGTAVHAAATGEVLFSATHGSYGNLVILKHGGGLVTVYGHNQINLVRKGQRVEAGQMIAKVGQTGRSSGPHLHFEVRRGTHPQNPLSFLPP